MKILVRLPNWLGDMVMSVAFMKQLEEVYPGAEVSVIIKEGLQSLLSFFPETKHQFIFSKKKCRGLQGAYRFGKMIAAKEKFDIFFCLPDSFSAAFIGFAAGARFRTGYRKEFRSFLLTRAFIKRKNIHRVEEYTDLLSLFSGKKKESLSITLGSHQPASAGIVVNINSEASSRRLPKIKAVSLINNLRARTTAPIVLTGSPVEKDFVDDVYNALDDKNKISNIAGKTNLVELADAMSNVKVILSTDSGVAHLGNALGVHTIVLFGAGNENKTAPFNREKCTVIRLGELSCEPCEDNTCKRFGTPRCLTLLNDQRVIDEVLKHCN
jgi:lipopolysaccharide heptosyltransferase II